MAYNAVIKAVAPTVHEPAGVGGMPGDPERYPGLEVVVDRAGAESMGWVIRLAFADYAGLEAEWNAGTATTVLQAAVATHLGAGGFNSDTLTAGQRAVIGVTMAVA